MQHLGEIISLVVAVSWTVTAIFADKASHRLGSMTTNVIRLVLASLFLAILLWITLGHPYPVFADGKAWLWLGLSALVGYVFGDWCLFNSYLTIGSRMGQLFMTLAPMFTALAAWVMLGQRLSWEALLAMVVTLSGIAVSVLGRDEQHHVGLDLPVRGVLYGIGAALGQGVGLVLSKVGLDCYVADVPASLSDQIDFSLPFASNMIRCVAGLACFSLWLVASGQGGRLRQSVGDRRGLLAMVVAVFSGPFVGVGFSLMAVQHTAAGIASTLMAMTPIIILLPSRWLFGQPITLRAVLGAVISVVGVSLFFLL